MEATAAEDAAAKSGDMWTAADENAAAANKHGEMWTEAEDNLIDTAVRHHKLRWKAIAAMLPGRTESGCRNRWVRNMERAQSETRTTCARPLQR